MFLVKMKNAFVPIEQIYSVNTYLGISLSHKGVSEVSEPVNGASEQSEQS